MQENNFLKFNNRQRGVSLIISFFVMTIILSIVLAVTTLLYSEIKMIRNIGNSVVAFYAADSGVEKVLYYDRKIIPTGATRGLCSIFSYDAETAPNECTTASYRSNVDSGLYCKDSVLTANDTAGVGCDPDVCTDCTIAFATDFPVSAPDNNEKSYDVTATVSPNVEDPTASNLTIGSMGAYKSLVRKVELYMTKAEASELMVIRDAYATPISSMVGTTISIVVEVEAENGISSIEAHIKPSAEGEDVNGSPISLILTSGSIYDGTFTGQWSGVAGAYYVDIYVLDTKGNGIAQPNIQPYAF